MTAIAYPRHGVGSLGHGYVTGACGDSCNNGQCRQGLLHPRCGRDCSALVVWDATGAPWTPGAANLQPPLLALEDWTPETAQQYADQLALEAPDPRDDHGWRE